jgi:3-deoxy-D-arabino-heptulosonate 7-phosphate (DAHP) synthase class II
MQGLNEIDAKEFRLLFARPMKMIEKARNSAPDLLISKYLNEIKVLNQVSSFLEFQQSFISNISKWKEIFVAHDASKCNSQNELYGKVSLFLNFWFMIH